MRRSRRAACSSGRRSSSEGAHPSSQGRRGRSTSRETPIIAAWNRTKAESDASGAAVLRRLEWFDRPEFAPGHAARHQVRVAPPLVARRHARPRVPVRSVAAAATAIAAAGSAAFGASALRHPPAAAPPHDPVLVGRRPAAAAHPAPVRVRRARPKPPPVGARPSARTLPTFTWTPVAGAGGYEFQLFKGSRLLFVARTPRPSLTVPPTWTTGGRLVRVSRGTYRWYVWPVIGGERRERAVVQAKLNVP